MAMDGYYLNIEGIGIFNLGEIYLSTLDTLPGTIGAEVKYLMENLSTINKLGDVYLQDQSVYITYAGASSNSTYYIEYNTKLNTIRRITLSQTINSTDLIPTNNKIYKQIIFMINHYSFGEYLDQVDLDQSIDIYRRLYRKNFINY
jgi:hypothetical protein